MIALALTFACSDGEPAEDPIEETWFVDATNPFPLTGWDPIFLVLHEETTQGGYPLDEQRIEAAEPTVVNAEGEEQVLVPATWHDYDYGWVGETPLPPGEYRIAAVEGRALDDEALVFEVSDIGQVPATWEAGATYDLEDIWSPGAGAVFRPYVDDTWLEVLEVSDGEVRFRVIYAFMDDAPCEVMVGVGVVDANGRLHWEHEDTLVNEGEVPFEVRELRLDLGLSSDGETLAGVEATAVLDTRPIDDALTDTGQTMDICGLAAGFGVNCLPCSDGVERCLAVGVRASTLTRTDEDFGDLPTCGADFSNIDVPTFDFDFDFDCSGFSCSAGPGGRVAGAGWFVLVLGLVGLRRR